MSYAMNYVLADLRQPMTHVFEAFVVMFNEPSGQWVKCYPGTEIALYVSVYNAQNLLMAFQRESLLHIQE